MILKFNVFGKLMSVHRIGEEWHLYRESEVGMRSRIYDVVIPAELKPDELLGYLDDIYHESAMGAHTSVYQIESE